jgi:Na+/H+ antiporter NhaD/arsenite permease-like protein
MAAPLSLLAALIALTLVGVAVGRYPGLRMNRATIALVGATLLVLLGALTLEQAYAAVDLGTLVLLLAMMILNGNLRLAGFFQVVTARVVRHARGPRQLLAWLVATSGVLSAIFLNDTIVLVFTPLVLAITAALRRNPIPYLVALVTAANVGSVATMIGNPQNMLVGLSSGLSFVHFTAALAPIALVGLVIVWGVVAFVYRRELAAETVSDEALLAELVRPRRRVPGLLAKAVLATALMIGLLAAGLAIPLAALAAAALLLITRRLKPGRVFREVDFSLLVFFAGLFVVTAAIETTGLSSRLFAGVEPLASRGAAALAVVAAGLSNLVSNVPAVLLFRPFMGAFADPRQAWLTLAMATTLAGNLTLLGSVANLIVAETARAHGVELSFREYLKAGVPITLLTLAWGIAWLSWTGG